MYLKCNMWNSTRSNNHAESQNQCWDMKGRSLRYKVRVPYGECPKKVKNENVKFVRMDVVHTRPARIIARRLAPRFLGSSFFFAGKRTVFSRWIAGRQHSDVLRNFTCERKIRMFYENYVISLWILKGKMWVSDWCQHIVIVIKVGSNSVFLLCVHHRLIFWKQYFVKFDNL